MSQRTLESVAPCGCEHSNGQDWPCPLHRLVEWMREMADRWEENKGRQKAYRISAKRLESLADSGAHLSPAVRRQIVREFWRDAGVLPTATEEAALATWRVGT